MSEISRNVHFVDIVFLYLSVFCLLVCDALLLNVLELLKNILTGGLGGWMCSCLECWSSSIHNSSKVLL